MSARSSELAALGAALDAVGDRWSLLLIAALMPGPRRFGDLRDPLGGIASNVLSARLQALTERGLVLATAYTERPPRFVYELTEAGRELAGALALLSDWGARRAGESEAPRHAACGGELRATWFCDTCGVPVEDPGSEQLDYA